MTEKKLPNAIIAMLVLFGFAFGSMSGGFLISIGIIINKVLECLAIWGATVIIALLVFQFLAWKYRGLLIEWCLIEVKEEKKQ